MLAMALIIYLDTQDYYNLFYERPDGPQHKVLEKLIQFRDGGDIAIGFSLFTILEFITRPDAKNREERVQRGRLIKEICGPNAFPNLPHLAKGAKFPNGGNWLYPEGYKIVSAKETRHRLRKSLAKELHNIPHLNRQQRRQLLRKNKFAELLRKKGAHFGRNRADYGPFPVSDETVQSRLFERFIEPAR